jgi:hypothetical protein
MPILKLALLAPVAQRHRPKLMGRLACAVFCLALGARSYAAENGAEPPSIRVDLLTMGPSDQVYARYGHAAFLVHGTALGDVVYNFGYANFRDPHLIMNFLRGKARFWVARKSYEQTLFEYRRMDRSVYLQRLNLSPEEHRALARALEISVLPENRTYIYHHFKDNCATRLRDLLDKVTQGELSRQLKGKSGVTRDPLRETVRRGLTGNIGLLMASDLILGRSVDLPLDAWQSAFLPEFLQDVLRQVRRHSRPKDVAQAADSGPAPTGSTRHRAASSEPIPDPLVKGPLASAPMLLYQRQGPDPLQGTDPRAGLKLLWAVAVLSLVAGACLIPWARQPRRGGGLVLMALTLITATGGAMVWTLALIATVPELVWNEVALILWPLDFALLWPAARWLRGTLWAGPLLRRYLDIRLLGLLLVAVGHGMGLLEQRPFVWLVMALSVVGGLRLALRSVPSRPPPSLSPPPRRSGKKKRKGEQRGGRR